MTALTELERLESPGAWRAGPDARLQEVVVSFGDATLILSDPKSDRPLTHWSLPAVTRLNPGEMPALYGPGSGTPDEQLEITEELMIDAIERVHRVIASRRAHPGRLRGGLTALAALAMLAALFIWLPQALIRHAARIAPPAQAAQVGRVILADMTRSTGAPCQRASGEAVLAYLAGKLLDPPARIVLLPADLGGVRRLPGNLYVAGQDMLDEETLPDLLAGHLLAASLASDQGEPLQQALDQAGLRAAVQLMTSGRMPSTALQGYGETLLTAPLDRPEDAALLAAMAEKNVSAEPYAKSLGQGGDSLRAMIAADPARDAPSAPVLTDEQWSALRLICAG